MADNDYNRIGPVAGLQNVGNITPAQRRQQKRKRQNSNGQDKPKKTPDEKQLNESIEENINSRITKNNRDENSIDYRA